MCYLLIISLDEVIKNYIHVDSWILEVNLRRINISLSLSMEYLSLDVFLSCEFQVQPNILNYLISGFCSIFLLNSVIIPTLQWILPDQCPHNGEPCSIDGIAKLYSFLRLGLLQLFYVSTHFLIFSLVVFIFSTHRKCVVVVLLTAIQVIY